ncbi:bifunctional DNA primase/polymerase [Rhodococcus pyridinivorans]|uniref:bifunctional DNA primase/polymerase n=1 Tax=Rhodococcus pyridinivorans TaxID=103816 RepID=UPI00266ED7E2|nr:bifunctional DNA primase/polymerase [Rhodococcus pyridinivorans]
MRGATDPVRTGEDTEPAADSNSIRLQSLLSIAQRGWLLFPCHSMVQGRCSCGKGNDCTSPGKHPRTVRGVKDATNNVDRLRAWHASYGVSANWALATGRESGVFVVDVDRKHNGFESFAAWESEHGTLMTPLRTSTGGGGKHLFFEYPDDVVIGNRTGWIPGVDIRGEGGYVLLPPSNHQSGGTYRWQSDGEPARAPLTLTQSIAKRERDNSTASAESDLYAPILEGNRNDEVFKRACRHFRELGQSRDEQWRRDEVFRRITSCEIESRRTFPDDEIMRTVQSAQDAVRAKGEDLPSTKRDKLIQDRLDWHEANMEALRLISERDAQDSKGRVGRFSRGGSFILDQPEVPTAVWGSGEQVLWAEGEALMLTGHQGTGKTTLAQQVILHRLGVRTGPFLGFDVPVVMRPVLYLAMDRPTQAARSMRRMVGEEHRAVLDEYVVVWSGPLPFDPLGSPSIVADWATEYVPDLSVVVVDSVKDYAAMRSLSDDSIASGLNSSWQELIARKIEVVLLHHERKAANGEKRRIALDNVFGSTLLTSGTGSVFGIEGNPGDEVVTLHHLKQPAETLPPLEVHHDHPSGTSTVHSGPRTVREVLALAGDNGATAAEIIVRLGLKDTENNRRKIRKEISDMADTAVIPGGQNPDGRGKLPDRYRLIAPTTTRQTTRQPDL